MAVDHQHRYAHIDAMRALAVMLVVIAHAGYSDIVPGGSGVTIFFSISGFIITYLLLREKDHTGNFNIRSFYLRRLLKIAPPLIICTIIPTLILAIVRPIDWAPFTGIVFFFYNWFATAHVEPPLPGTNVVWSLSIEEQFYLAFALIWLVTLKSGARIRWLAAIAATALVWSTVTRVVLASLPGDHTDRIYFGSDTRLDGIAWGVLAAIAFHHSLQRTGKIRSFVHVCGRDSALIGAALLYLISLAVRDEWFRDAFRFTLQAMAASVVIIYGFGSDRSLLRTAFNSVSRLRIVQYIGLASYSIYLAHMVAIYFSEGLLSDLPDVVVKPLLAVWGVCAGMVVYLAVERPVQLVRRRLTAVRPTADPDCAPTASAAAPTTT